MTEKKKAAAPRAARKKDTPDAILMPVGWTDPGRPWGGGLIDHQCSAAEAILGGQHPHRTAWMTHVPGNRMIVSLAPNETECYPTGHQLEKHPRFDWEPQENGLSYGYLKEDDQPDRSSEVAVREAVQGKLSRWKDLMDKGEKRKPEEQIEYHDLSDELFPGRPAIVQDQEPDAKTA